MTQELRTIPDGWRDFLAFSGFDLLCEVDREGRYREISANYGDLMGLSLEELRGKTPMELGLIHPDDVDRVWQSVRPLMESNELVRFEYRFRARDGGWRWMETTGNPFLTPAGEWRALLISRDITDRKFSEEALRESEFRYRWIFDQASLGILHFDSRGVILDCNENFERIMGAPRGALIGFDMLASLSCPPVRKAILDALSGGRGQYEGPYEAVTSGKEMYARFFTYGAMDENGICRGGIGIVEDVTAPRTAEMALARESALLRDIIDHNPMSIQLLDREGYTLKVNASHTRLFQAVPPPDYSLFSDPLLVAQGLMDLIRQLREGQVVFFPEFYHNPHEIYSEFPDCPVWIRMVAFPILGADGRPERFVLMHEDITERRKAEDALRESEDRFRGLYMHTTDAIFWVGVGEDGSFRYEGSNPAHQAMAGLSEEQIVGRSPEECLPHEQATEVTVHYRSCLESGMPVTYEVNQETEKGPRFHQTILVPIRNREGRIYRLVGTSRDLTPIKQTEEALRQAQKLESLGVLAGGIAHDFNNLLTAILGNLNMAQLTLSPESPAQPHLEAVEQTVLKASDLTRQMLAYSGKGRFVVRHLDLNEVVREMTHLLQVSISKKIGLRFRFASSLPAIEADAAQIQQVIMNLVTNASDAIGDEEGTITISTHLQELDPLDIARIFSAQELGPGRFVVLEVGDTGCGISPETLDRIFDPFFTTKASGRGLGLSAMLGILRGHGGGFKIYSEVGRGTLFKVYFPAGQEPAVASFRPAAEAEGELHGTVLVVDDEPAILKTLDTMLRRFGLQVITARDGVEALERFQENRDCVDLVLMDLTMPRMDGRETFVRMRRLCPDLSVILSSGYNEQETVQDFLGKGLAGFIQKPYQLKELRKILASALSRKS